jgi:asparagine synthase (glutamine-hydrolysing)
MCGITGFWDPTGVNEVDARGIVARMAGAIRHRGPDDGGDWIDPQAGIALGARRLAILDLTPLGHQPMQSADGRHVIAFNGEIYNFHDLRAELEAAGARFRGRSDTEVLLAAIAIWGVRRTLERSNGMFAIAVWDRETRALHLARDRAGEKPLYYGWAGQTLLFGSELKALRAHPSFRADINRTALAAFFQRGYVPGPLSIYRGIYKLPPASLLTLRADHGFRGAPVPYWSMDEVAKAGLTHPFRGSVDDAADALDGLLRDAVRMRMEADVPLGAFLSGGIDSSLVVALMQAQSSRPVRTFTIGFHESRYNEAQYAKAVAHHLGTEHTELYVTPEEARAVIPQMATLYDEPFADTSQIPTSLLCALAQQSVTVSLSGDAGDELFGGYRRHQLGPSIWRTMRWIPYGLRRNLARVLALSQAPVGLAGRSINRLARRWTGKRSLSERIRQTADIIATRSPAELYRVLMTFWKHSPSPQGRLLSAGDLVAGPNLGAVTHTMMFLDAIGYLPDDILVKVDRAAMGVSLETRIPLLDPRVIAFAWQLPLRLKIRGGEGKWLLRRVLYRYVPRALVSRPKQGFGIPIAEWLRRPLRDWAEALLDERHLRQDGLLDPAPIRRKWSEHLSGETRWDYQLWTVLMFQAWAEAQQMPEVLARSA